MSILNVNKINPVGGGSTITIAGIASVTNNISVGNSVTASSFHGNLTGNVTGSGANLTSIPAGNLTGTVADARISTLTASKLSGALPAISGANLTGISVGTEVYDTWIYTAETNIYAAGNYLTSNWSRFGDNIGSAITQSSGVFSFPSTGYYQVTFTCNFFERNGPDNICYIYIQTTTDNNASAYVTRAASLENITDRSGDTYATCHAHILFDVTNTTTHKVRFFCGSDASGDLRIAGANYQQVYATFQKMANT